MFSYNAKYVLESTQIFLQKFQQSEQDSTLRLDYNKSILFENSGHPAWINVPGEEEGE